MLRQQRERVDKGKGPLRVTAPDRKGAKGLKGQRWGSFATFRRRQSDAVLLLIVNWCSLFILLLKTEKRSRFFKCKKTVPEQSGTAFSLSTHYLTVGSGCLMSPSINIRRNEPLAADIQIIRPPLHHFHAGFQMLRFMHIRRPHAVAFLVAHLAFDSILRP